MLIQLCNWGYPVQYLTKSKHSLNAVELDERIAWTRLKLDSRYPRAFTSSLVKRRHIVVLDYSCMLGLQGRQAHSLPEKPGQVCPLLDLLNLQQLILICFSSEMPSQSPPQMSTCPERVSYPWLYYVLPVRHAYGICMSGSMHMAGSGAGVLGNAQGIK